MCIPGEPELYRLDRDPEETQNLADAQDKAELQRLVSAAFASLEPPPISEEVRPMSPEARERLKAQGYLE